MARPAAEFLQTTGALRQLRRLGVATRSCYGARHQHQSTPSPARRPSPYRLLQPHAFLAEFAPLHVNGWRVDALEDAEKLLEADRVEEVLDGAQAMQKGDLQGRRLVRVFELGEGKEGWRRLIKFVGQVGQVIEDQDHHPTIHISSFSDYISRSPSLLSFQTQTQSQTDYIVELSTHTHTPLPPYPLPAKGNKMRPGVTGKDIKLAQKVEEVYGELVGKVEVKEE
ncbi:hypothetical protein I307_01064 [Cryptococcus deuterogattii 99/473]|uniref:4a-hydroxytetrahydrobiopterin dehydratase n=2 Tax=Cryptococcus deuterogattii TaxID=1859096 RepID=A0A0D0V856_9TREE|nr:hypothetical protein CNBG_0643 [Cryptococcus deuterogattii R265]KIR42714.1 hypothetical protein I313_00917 [Cryptococcus deuterogattii Ram5]KIR75761.1 hypothetical protein I310_00458 [Cryptococcus deuterogattii CA1014]KIS02198.1 hypothetical protein L804_00458 [Cryptococcus deuterogattii 2001/935-1]KIY59395.1 hypothetical protein I307_01064 [Cryptococcus deuterogattii 99/473]